MAPDLRHFLFGKTQTEETGRDFRVAEPPALGFIFPLVGEAGQPHVHPLFSFLHCIVYNLFANQAAKVFMDQGLAR